MHLFDTEARIATAVAVLLVVIGAALALLSGGIAEVIGVCLVGAALVIVVAVAFYLVGRSEDLDRIHHPHG